MPFENQSSGPELEWMRDGLADMFIADLSRSPKLTVLSRQQLQVGLNRIGHEAANAVGIEEALKVAQKSHAEAFVMGSYAKFGNKLRIEVQIHDARNGQLLKDESLVVDRPEELLTQVDLLSLKLATFWGGRPAQAEKSGLGDVMTDNLEAYRYYSLGMEKVLGLRSTDAIAFFQKAVDLDPQFAMAYARIGYTYAVVWGHPDEGKPYLEKAYQLSPRLTDKDRRSIAIWYAIANRDYASVLKQYREFISRYPMETEAYWQLGKLLEGEDQEDEAIAVLQRALVVDPEEPETYNSLGGLYTNLGRHKEAIAMQQHYVALSPKEANAHDSLGLSYQWAGLYREAIEEYDKALALDPKFEIAVVHLANVHFQMGHYRKAIRLNQSYIEIAPSEFERLRGYTNLAWIRWKQGNLDEAEQEAKKSGDLAKGWAPFSVVITAERGDLKTAEELSQHLSATDPPFPGRGVRIAARYLLYAQGYVALKEGHADKAIELFKETLRHLPVSWDIDSYESCLADAYLQLGRYDEAIAEYQRILRLNPNYPLVHYRLGLAYERKGQSSQARAEFRHFLEVWKDADTDIPEVIAAKQRLAT
jgi:tetratricopeptide (TPR) repeat protein